MNWNGLFSYSYEQEVRLLCCGDKRYILRDSANTSNMFSLSARAKINQPINFRQVAISSPQACDIANTHYSGWEAYDLEVFYSLVSLQTWIWAESQKQNSMREPDSPGPMELKQR